MSPVLSGTSPSRHYMSNTLVLLYLQAAKGKGKASHAAPAAQSARLPGAAGKGKATAKAVSSSTGRSPLPLATASPLAWLPWQNLTSQPCIVKTMTMTEVMQEVDSSGRWGVAGFHGHFCGMRRPD